MQLNQETIGKLSPLIDEGYAFLRKVHEQMPKNREVAVAITQVETGMLWLRDAITKEAMKPSAVPEEGVELK